MSEKMTPARWAAKVEWEGGLYEAVAGYGLSHRDLDRADDPGFYDAVEEYVKAVIELEKYADEVESYISELVLEYDDDNDD